MSRSIFGRRRALPALAALVMLLTGCTTSAPGVPDEPAPEPFAACPAPAPPVGDGPDVVPDVTLPCFTGGQSVSLRSLGRPALINLWASWCGPCRDELPALQAFADQVGDRAIVLGVVTYDGRDPAAWAAAGFGVSYPSLFDPDRVLAAALGRPILPVTLFVDATGVVRRVDTSGSLTLEKLKLLASEHLGVST